MKHTPFRSESAKNSMFFARKKTIRVRSKTGQGGGEKVNENNLFVQVMKPQKNADKKVHVVALLLSMN